AEPASPNLTENRVFAREVAKERWLANFQNLHDIFYSGVLITVFAKQANRGFDDFLAKPRLLPLAQPLALRDNDPGSAGRHPKAHASAVGCGHTLSRHLRNLLFTTHKRLFSSTETSATRGVAHGGQTQELL